MATETISARSVLLFLICFCFSGLTFFAVRTDKFSELYEIRSWLDDQSQTLVFDKESFFELSNTTNISKSVDKKQKARPTTAKGQPKPQTSSLKNEEKQSRRNPTNKSPESQEPRPNNDVKSSEWNLGSQKCTFALLREYNKQRGYFPSSGTWDMTNPAYFKPDFCELTYRRYPRDKMARCLDLSKSKSVMTMGDSNGSHMSRALRMVINPQCRTMRVERPRDPFMPDPNYYRPQNKNSSWNKYITVKHRTCRSCFSKQTQCAYWNEKKKINFMTFSHLALTSVVDSTLQIKLPNNESYLTTQDVLLRHFLKSRMPDVLLVFLPFNHARGIPLTRVRSMIEYFVKLAGETIPRRTKLFYMPAFAEFTFRVKPASLLKDRTREVDTMNHDMYQLLENKFLDPKSSTFGFLDVLNISRARVDWSNGVHMGEKWYDIIMSMFWEIFCNSVEENAF